MQEITSDIIKIDGELPGPTVAIFAGVHGNETAGIYALQEIIPNLRLVRGSVIFAFANPAAISDNVRMKDKNLNRCFTKNSEGNSYEEVRARELMNVLDGCDALLDIHMFSDPKGEPFVICEENAFEIAKLFDVNIISTNWSRTEPGATDGYMYTIGKIGICIECGPIPRAKDYVDYAKKTIYQFLQYFEIIGFKVNTSTQPKRIIRAENRVVKDNEQLQLSEGLHNFDHLEKGQIIAQDGERVFYASEGECIIFPRYYAHIGQELYISGFELPEVFV